MGRILVLGAPASGKSTLAGELAQALDIPAYHLQALFWGPNWQPTPASEWLERVRDLTQRPEWVIEGNNLRTLELRLAAADTIVFLDLPRPLCLYRAIKRRLLIRWRPPRDLAEGSKPQFDLQLLKWVWSFRAEQRPLIIGALASLPPGKRVITLKRPAQVRRFVAELQRPAADEDVEAASRSW